MHASENSSLSLLGEFTTEVPCLQNRLYKAFSLDEMKGNLTGYPCHGDGSNITNTSRLGPTIDHFSVLQVITEKDLLPRDLPWSIKTFFIVSYAVIMLLSVVGNLFVICVVSALRKMRSVTNTFLVSLAVSDLLIASLNMPLQLRFHLTNEWTLGEFMCKFTNYIQGVTIVASIFTLTGLAADRYYAICHPLRARHVHTYRRAMGILIVFWAVAFILVLPQLVIQRLEPFIRHQPNETPPIRLAMVCTEFFREFALSAAYTIIFYLVLYLIPVIVMFATYGKIAYTLWVREPIGEIAEGSRDRRMSEKKRVVRMLVVIVVLFAISWFPFFTGHVYLLFHDSSESFRITMAILQLFGYSNSCTNPIVYCFMNQSFRQNYLKYLPFRSRRSGTFTSGYSMDNDRTTGKFETTNNTILMDESKNGNRYEVINQTSKL